MLNMMRGGILLGCGIALVGCATTEPAKPEVALQLIESDDGLSEIRVPTGWQTRPNIGRNADLRLSNEISDNYLLITTYLPDELEEMSLEQAAERMTDAIREGAGGGEMSGPRKLSIGGQPAIERELRAQMGETRLVFLSTVVQGREARYHLVGWGPAKTDLDALRRAMANFRESDAKRTAKNRVNLDFKWPGLMTSRGSIRAKQSKGGEFFEMQGDFVSAVKAAGKDELLISTRLTRQQASSSLKNKSKELDAKLLDVLKTAATDIPDYVVNRDGEFVRIENLGAYHKRVQDAVLKSLPKGNAEANAKASELVKMLLTEATLSTSMRETWSNAVESWAGGSYAVGQPYKFTTLYQTPAMGNRSFPTEVTQQLTGYVPCYAGAAPKSCVRLVQSSRVAGPEYTRAVGEAVSKTVGSAVKIDSMEIESTVELITDPKTLRPYRTQEKKVKRITMTAEAKTETREDVEEVLTSYSY